MPLSKERKQEIVAKYGKGNENNTGSTEVQIALLTARIDELSQHLQENTKDHHGRRGLLTMVGKRKRLLSYLEKNDYEGYKGLIQSLGLRR
jgi:small subunit ribosomal protein S15